MPRINPTQDALICLQRQLTEGESLARCLVKRQTENERKTARAARDVSQLPGRLSGAGSRTARLFDAMTQELRGDRMPRWRFWSGADGQACIKLLHRLDARIVTAELRRRGLDKTAATNLRQGLFEHVRNRIAGKLLDGLRDCETRLSQLIRDPAARAQAIDRLASAKDARLRLQMLRSLGITGEEARSIARAPRRAEDRLLQALRVTENELGALRHQLLMTGQSAKASLTTFHLLKKAVNRIRAGLGVPAKSGSFASNAVDSGLRDARAAREAERLYGKFVGAAISITGLFASGGASLIHAPLAAGLKGAPAAGSAVHERRLAETGATLGLADRATVDAAREEARRAVQKLKRDVVLAFARKLGTKMIDSAFEVAFRKLMGPTLDELDADQAKQVVEDARKLWKAGRKNGGSWTKAGIAAHEADR